MALYLGTNYHPHDWLKERWKTDIRLMQEAGFQIVRLGHLCWDSFEPEEGVYTFEWFDEVMDLFAGAGIRVFLDISVRPAPVWVHRLCPGCVICGKSGNPQASLRRYMEDIADPDYQHYALRFAEILIRRYRSHPALFAFGLCNEIGDGYISHSEAARSRFVRWLERKYRTVDALNEAWAARRWSRKLNNFEDAVLPENEIVLGPPEAWLDMKRFWSDDIGAFIVRLRDLVAELAPDLPHSSNHYAEKQTLGFDYLKFYDRFVDYPGMGFYCSYEMSDQCLFNLAVYHQRIAETGKPMWCLEFQTGSRGTAFGPYGAVRMYVMLCLLHRAQMFLGWTFRSMLGGEEQYLFGMLGHDGFPTPNYREYQWVAKDLKKLENYAFPYLPTPEIAVAFSYDSCWSCQYGAGHYRMSYPAAMTETEKVFFRNNRDFNVVDLRKIRGNYKLLLVPHHIILEPVAAQALRDYVAAGGTVVMTGYSAAVDEHNQVFGIPHPGLLDDVFGLRVAGHQRTDMKWTFSEGAAVIEKDGVQREVLKICSEDGNLEIVPDYYELLELHSARCMAEFEGKCLCAIAENDYGKGHAYYTAAETNAELLFWLIEKLAKQLGLQDSPAVSEGIQARRIAPGQEFYVNITEEEKEIPLKRSGRGVLSEEWYSSVLRLKPYDAELILSDEMAAGEGAL